MEAIQRETNDGLRWLFGAGMVAVLIAGFVAWSDHTLSTSTRESDLGDTLRELRSAQASLHTGSIDRRQVGGAVLRDPPAPAVIAAGKAPAQHGHHETHGH